MVKVFEIRELTFLSSWSSGYRIYVKLKHNCTHLQYKYGVETVY